MNWKEQFDKSFVVNGLTSSWGNPTALKHFISTEIIEKLIDEIPDSHYSDSGMYITSNKQLKQQLRDKWLWVIL